MGFARNPDPEKPTTNGTHPRGEPAVHGAPGSGGLSRAAPAHADLARWLLMQETGVGADAPALSDAAERVFQKLFPRLSRLVSATGSQAILSRALHLTRAEFPFLDGVHAGRAPGVCLEGLRERVHDPDVDQAGKGLLAVLGTVLDLLAGFIGEDLTLRLVQEVWPDLPLREPSRPITSDGQEATS